MKYSKLSFNHSQDIQDEIFRKMSAERKLKLTSQFFSLARKLNPAYFKKLYGTRRIIGKTGKHS